MENSRYFTPGELAKLLGVSKQRCYIMIKTIFFHRNSSMKTATDFTFYRSILLCKLLSH